MGWSYDAAGNRRTGDSDNSNTGSPQYVYDALNRHIRSVYGGGAEIDTNSYNGDGVLVEQTTGLNATTTRYTQDLLSPLSQILADGSSSYVYGHERLYGQTGATRTWYASDALGSVRHTLDAAGVPGAAMRYDPWGVPQSSPQAPFGFTGELQNASGLTYLRARWYAAGSGTFTARDPFAGWAEQPYSMHPYQYAYSAPTVWTDPSGKFIHCTFDPLQGYSFDCRLWTSEEWWQAAEQARDSIQQPKNRLISELLNLSIFAAGKGVLEGIFGEDLLTGNHLSWWERGLGLSCLIDVPRLGVLDDIPSQSSESVLRAIYRQADGGFASAFDIRNASKPAKFGYAPFLSSDVPSGSSWFDFGKWIDEGLASLESYNKGWQTVVSEVMKNTNTINFVIDGMDFTNPVWVGEAKEVMGSGWRTHWEMDEVIKKGYLSKLHLWQNGQEIVGLERARWIDAWKQLRGLP